MPTTTPRVSVVMAVGPDLRFLDQAVDSVLASPPTGGPPEPSASSGSASRS